MLIVMTGYIIVVIITVMIIVNGIGKIRELILDTIDIACCNEMLR